MLDEDVAYVVENDVLLHAVNTELSTTGVNVVYGAKIQNYSLPKTNTNKQNSTVTMENGDTYSCTLLVSKDISINLTYLYGPFTPSV